MKVAIIGSRTIVDRPDPIHPQCPIEWEVQRLVSEYGTRFTIVSGGARGVDAEAKSLAEEYGLPYEEFPADWEKHGKRAGFLRNARIVNEADIIIVFWDGKSRGTRMTIDLAIAARKETHVYFPTKGSDADC